MLKIQIQMRRRRRRGSKLVVVSNTNIVSNLPIWHRKMEQCLFFEYSGNAIASEESVRITPSLRSQKGMIWSRLVTSFDWWEVELQFRVTGRGRIGADGLAFWFTATKGFEGPVFGSSDKWQGLGVFFDSFDNDNKHNNPYIMSMVNDGSKAYDHQKDGTTQQLAGCLRDFRNKPFPVRAKIEFFKNTLTVMFHNGMSNNDKEYEMCMRVENVVLPKNGYFGISAATGGLADDHDVLKFSVSSLRTPEEAKVLEVDPDSKKFQEDFDDYNKKLADQKKDYFEKNPDAKQKADPDDWDNWFSEQDKELQQIFQGQSAMREVLTDLHRKMDEIITRQERTLSLVSQGSKAPAGGTGGQPQIGVDTIRRDEVNAVLANQREIVSASRDIKNLVSDIHGKTGQLLTRGTGSAQEVKGGGGSYQDQQTLREIRDSINNVKREFSQTAQQIASTPCPSGGCVSTTVLVALLGVQLLILISFMMYRDGKEKAAKKYY